MRRSPARWRPLWILALLVALPPPREARASDDPSPRATSGTRVAGLIGFHEHGQTFLRWLPPPGTGWRYRVYRAAHPIRTESELAAAVLYAELGDSSALDRRLSRLTGTLHGHVVRESPRVELLPGQGLCVVTPGAARQSYYAVTSQPTGAPEDRTLVQGENTLANPIAEDLDSPRPVHQRDLWSDGRLVAVHSLFVSHLDTPLFPAMANRPGVAFDCGIVQEVPGPTPGLLLLKPHARGGSFLAAAAGTRTPGEYVLALDDPLPNGENTFWFGYHPDYDVTRTDNVPPTSGEVVDYTFRRIRHTIDWALGELPVDPTRVYAFGYSMGGIGSLEFALWMPGRIAAVMSVLGKFDFSFLDEPDPTAWFNPTSAMRRITDQMWGRVDSRLRLADGHKVYERLNLGDAIVNAGPRDVPPIITVNGKRDNVVGWAEKLGFYAAMRDHRHGGAFYWDQNDHYGNFPPSRWTPIVEPATLYRFRSNVSYPAFTNCQYDSRPGDGTFASGDTVGCINGYLDWREHPTDLPGMWRDTLMTRDLRMNGYTVAAPESCLVDVTPNRLQRFRLLAGVSVPYQVHRQSDMALVQSGFAITDALGRPTAPRVRVYRTGTIVTFGPFGALDAGGERPVGRLSLALGTNPVRGVLRVNTSWPEGASGRVQLLDIAGRVVLQLHAGPRPPAGELAVSTGGLPPGLYLVHATAGGETASRRVIVIH